MRLAFNGTFLDEGYHGTGTYTRGLLRSLAAEDHSGDEIIVYSCSRGEVPNGFRVGWRPSPRFLTASQGSFANVSRFLWTQAVLPFRLQRDRVDAYLSPLAEGMLRSTARQVIVVHDLIPLLYADECPRLHLYFKHVLPGILQGAKKVIADSEHTRQDIIRYFGVPAENIAVVYGGIEPLYFSSNGDQPPSSPLPDDFFLFVGTFTPRKNLKAIIRAFARIHREVPHRLVLVARRDRKFAPGVLSLADRLGVLDKITILSNLSLRQMLFLYRKASALLLLSEYEGFGYPPLEAMSVGTPSIVSEGTSLAEIVSDAAIRVRSGDIPAISESMRKIAVDHEFRQRYSQLGWFHARQFDWGTAAGKMKALLRNLFEA